MFEDFIAKSIMKRFKRPDISKAYEMKGPEDSWYDTLKKVHESLAEIQKHPHELWEITSFDGLKLKAVHYPCLCDSPKGTVMFVHGFTSHAERESAFPGLFYLSLGYNFVVPYQRAHGLSEGNLITFGALERQDMLDWIDKINSVYGASPLVVHGLSMGGGIALQLCDSNVQNLRAIVADAPSDGIERSFRAMARSTSSNNPEKVFERLCRLFQEKCSKSLSVTNVLPHIEKSGCPILFTAGSKENAEKRLENYKTVCPQPCEVVILPGCNHGNGMYKQTQMYQNGVTNFLDSYVK